MARAETGGADAPGFHAGRIPHPIPAVPALDLTQFLFALDETDLFPGDRRTEDCPSLLELW